MSKQAKVEVAEWDDKAYLRFLPPHLQERYIEGLQDPTLTHLSRQIALMDVRIKQLLENLDRQILTEDKIMPDLEEEFPHLKPDDLSRIAKFIMGYLPETFIDHRTFRRFEGLIERMENAQLDGRIRDADRAKRQLYQAIREGRREGDVWDQIKEAMEERRKLVVAEERRLTENQQSLTLDKVVMLLGMTISALKESVRKYVSDQQVQQYILEDADRHYRRQLGSGYSSEANK